MSRVRIEVTEPLIESNWVALKRLPGTLDDALLVDQLVALAGERVSEDLEEGSVEDVLQRLWPRSYGLPNTTPPAFRQRQPASFLVISPAVEGRIDLETARLVGVWIDGREVAKTVE